MQKMVMMSRVVSTLPGFSANNRFLSFSSSIGMTKGIKSFSSSSSACSRIYSGIQPSGQLHLGNYLGAVSNWVKLQDQYSPLDGTKEEKKEKDAHPLIFCIVDQHAMTSARLKEGREKNANLEEATMEMARCLLACGIDPERALLYRQSDVAEHCKLTWLLGCSTSVNKLTRMIEFKEKSEKRGGSGGTLGLLAYPVLMASDVLLFDTTHVPVGEDQRQHIELIRRIASSFNVATESNVFVEPEAVFSSHKRVMSLTDGTSKMSKSDPNPSSRIHLSDDPDTIKKKILKAKTDSQKGFTYEEARPEICNLLEIYAAISGIQIETLCSKYRDSSNFDFKQDLADVLIGELEPIRQRYLALEKDPAFVKSALKRGKEEASEIAAKTYSRAAQHLWV